MHQLSSFLSRFNIDQEELLIQIFPLIQEHVVETIRPTEEQMREWRNSPEGRQEFERYMLSKFTVVPSKRTIRTLWDIYNGKRQTSRDKALVRSFIEAHRYAVACAHCGLTEGKFHVDHIIPLSRGGRDEPENLQFLCVRCNLKKSNRYDSRKPLI
ncbi:HNH endonuclease [Exiguobacterium profundum]|uniref:HNH endonuclease n=1 Tax=Exiguobacterium profundum TaxID=307643 RepID=UPI0009FD5C62|nr:HNH endonuclease signature motif containing protein [Exiguobacterium profundum]